MILCCGEALIDMVPAPIPGKGEGFYPFPGGSPYNTAIAIGRLGVPVQFWGKLSRDFFGEMLFKGLAENHVGTGLISRSPRNTTLAFVSLAENREPQYIFYTADTADRSLSKEDIPRSLPDHTSAVLFGSIAMTMEPIASTIESFILQKGGPGISDPVISFDPNIRAFMIADKTAYIRRFENLVAASTVVKISRADLDFIYPGMETDILLRKILDMGPRLAVLTLGPEGALALLRREGGGILRVSAPAVDLPVVDTIGAGDTFHGALLARLEMQKKLSPAAIAILTEAELYDALSFANRAASLVCSVRGAAPPSLAEVEALVPCKH
ncbi:MAG: carbohydrate kinase [Treponema sp.]|jgi:fructokinase|nr:carbohydrate kinase [Treponema sp.]